MNVPHEYPRRPTRHPPVLKCGRGQPSVFASVAWRACVFGTRGGCELLRRREDSENYLACTCKVFGITLHPTGAQANVPAKQTPKTIRCQVRGSTSWVANIFSLQVARFLPPFPCRNRTWKDIRKCRNNIISLWRGSARAHPKKFASHPAASK